MDRINHVKIVTPDPAAVDRFLREVLDVPAGWALGGTPEAAGEQPTEDPGSQPPAVTLSAGDIDRIRGAARWNGFITGSTESRQFQIVEGEKGHVWAVAIGTRHLERAYERCRAEGIVCTEPAVNEWGDGTVRFFFAEVGGVLFEVMRAEPPAGS